MDCITVFPKSGIQISLYPTGILLLHALLGEPSSRTVIGGEDFYNAHAIRIERVTAKMIEFTVVTRHQRWDGQKNVYIDAIETTDYKRFKRKENVLYALRRKYEDYFIHQQQGKQKA